MEVDTHLHAQRERRGGQAVNVLRPDGLGVLARAAVLRPHVRLADVGEHGREPLVGLDVGQHLKGVGVGGGGKEA